MSSAERDPKSVLRVGQIGVGVMALALVLPWLSYLVMSRSYLSICISVVEALFNLPKGTPGPSGGDLLTLAGLAAPLVAVLIGLGSVFDTSKESDNKGRFGGFLASGGLGLLGVAGFYHFCSKTGSIGSEAMGTGVYLFAVAALVVLVTGIIGVSSKEN